MKIQISNRHDTAHPNIKTVVEYGLDDLATRYEILSADVILDHEGNGVPNISAEFSIKLKGVNLFAKETSEKIEKSVDLAFKSLEKQLHKYKETHYSSLEGRREGAKLKSMDLNLQPE